ncbi:MAG: hypothetical protein LBN24_02205 [Mediterranea sp.]|jgi:hypothetical protein|nr:hypothetical protein [Mediterranea sp.]
MKKENVFREKKEVYQAPIVTLTIVELEMGMMGGGSVGGPGSASGTAHIDGFDSSESATGVGGPDVNGDGVFEI